MSSAPEPAPADALWNGGALRLRRIAAAMSAGDLRAALLSHGFTASVSAIYGWERNESTPSPLAVAALALVFGCESSVFQREPTVT